MRKLFLSFLILTIFSFILIVCTSLGIQMSEQDLYVAKKAVIEEIYNEIFKLKSSYSELLRFDNSCFELKPSDHSVLEILPRIFYPGKTKYPDVDLYMDTAFCYSPYNPGTNDAYVTDDFYIKRLGLYLECGLTSDNKDLLENIRKIIQKATKTTHNSTKRTPFIDEIKSWNVYH